MTELLSKRDQQIKKMNAHIATLDAELLKLRSEMSKIVKDHKEALSKKEKGFNYKSQENLKAGADALLKHDKKVKKQLSDKDKEIEKLKKQIESANGCKPGVKKFTCDEIKSIRKASSTGTKVSELSTVFKCSKDTIRRIVNHITYKQC